MLTHTYWTDFICLVSNHTDNRFNKTLVSPLESASIYPSLFCFPSTHVSHTLISKNIITIWDLLR